MTNTVDTFFNAIVEGLVKHEGFNEHIKGIVSTDGLHEEIGSWMHGNFCLSDYGFDITDYSYEIYGMIDDHVDSDFVTQAITDVEWEVKVKGSR